jgi:hypothetical protein
MSRGVLGVRLGGYQSVLGIPDAGETSDIFWVGGEVGLEDFLVLLLEMANGVVRGIRWVIYHLKGVPSLRNARYKFIMLELQWGRGIAWSRCF